MRDAIKILHVYQSGSYSGAEAYALEVANHHALTNDVTFLAKAASPLAQRITEMSSHSKLRLCTKISNSLFADFDVVILHSTQELKTLWPHLAFAKIRAKFTRESRPKVVLYTHIWISHSKKDPLHAIPYSIVDRVWTSSDQSRRALIRFLPVAPEKIEIVRYGRNTRKFIDQLLPKNEARAKLGIPSDVTVVGTLARVDKGKGSLELFEAVTDLMQTRADLHLLMIGPPTDGDPKATVLDQELHRTIDRLAPSIRSRVHKIGRLEGGSYYLTAFDLFILATYKENFALTLLEALCAKVPCLATDSGGSPDVVRPHATGWLFLPESTESLRTTLMTALDQKEKWNEFGIQGHKLVVENFDFTKVMADLDTKIRAMLD